MTTQESQLGGSTST